MKLELILAQYQENDDEETLRSLSPYLDHEVPTEPLTLTKADCLSEAHDKARLESYEAEAYWLLMAAGCDGS